VKDKLNTIHHNKEVPTYGSSGTNFRGPAVRKGARGRTMWHLFLSFSVVSLFIDCTNQPL